MVVVVDALVCVGAGDNSNEGTTSTCRLRLATTE